MKKLLFLNACVNRDISRTYRIAKELIALLKKSGDFEITELVLEKENTRFLTSETLNIRNELVDKGDLFNEKFHYANQFKEADCVVIAAPYWDFGFPAMLKTYIEEVNVRNIVYEYGECGELIGLCKAEKIYYVTTRGGNIGDGNDFGFATMVQLGKFYGIPEVKCISADGFDIPGNDIEALIQKAVDRLPNII